MSIPAIANTPATRIVRLYALTPQEHTVNGRKIAGGATVTIGLRYSEAEAADLPRESAAAAREAIKVAKRRRDIPEGFDPEHLEVVCVRETLKRDRS